MASHSRCVATGRNGLVSCTARHRLSAYSFCSCTCTCVVSLNDQRRDSGGFSSVNNIYQETKGKIAKELARRQNTSKDKTCLTFSSPSSFTTTRMVGKSPSSSGSSYSTRMNLRLNIRFMPSRRSDSSTTALASSSSWSRGMSTAREQGNRGSAIFYGNCHVATGDGSVGASRAKASSNPRTAA